MKILITNDDGIEAPGLATLVQAFAGQAEIAVAAPDQERSATSHSVTLRKPIGLRELGKRRWAIEGTPVDCVHLAVLKLLDFKPDLVISGINHGANLGCDIIYSGTVAGAREAALLGFPAFAISLNSWNSHPNFQPAAEFAVKLARQVLARKIQPPTFLNVNLPDLPPAEIKPFRITRQGRRIYSKKIEEILKPNGQPGFVLGGDSASGEPIEDSDIVAVDQGHISITPLQLDTTSYPALLQLRGFKI
ncbi:MAG: 5'/3'-nucleotidase SurE [Deltaproteobacteria bacterium RBG_13_61_14]|nr:MAG: 5'/3'-nucleotidase SurE [Deltaproteobacteria bacterium RBG_13_61_14]